MTAIKIRVTVQIRYLAPEVMERQGRGITARGGGYDMQLHVECGHRSFCFAIRNTACKLKFEHKRSVCALMITKCGTVSV